MGTDFDILEWILRVRPGRLHQCEDRVEIEHLSGEHTTLFHYPLSQKNGGVSTAGSICPPFDGADLFSSTFKIASSSGPKYVGGVCLVGGFSDMRELARIDGARFPAGYQPVMYQAGIGYYAFRSVGEPLLEWDVELQELSASYMGVEEVLQEWIDAIDGI